MICDRVDIDLDIRTLPGETPETVQVHLVATLGELAGEVEVTAIGDAPATESPIDTPMWDAVGAAAQAHFPDADCCPE